MGWGGEGPSGPCRPLPCLLAAKGDLEADLRASGVLPSVRAGGLGAGVVLSSELALTIALARKGFLRHY